MTDMPIRLRDATPADADMLDAWARSPEAKGEFNDFGPPQDDSFDIREALAKGPLRNERNGQLIVERESDGQPIGTVGWHEVHYGPPPSRGHGTSASRSSPRPAAMALAASPSGCSPTTCSRQTDAHRVEAQTDVDNVAEQRALEKAGFVREGVARGSQFRAGAYHDLITFARLREDQ